MTSSEPSTSNFGAARPSKGLFPRRIDPIVPTEIRTGASSWTSDAWWGRVYPEGTPPAERLRLYAGLFDCVEVDATYYTQPIRRVVEGWYDRTPPGFLFTLKVTRDLLDPKQAVDSEKLQRFVSTAQLLREKLGPLLLQFPPWVKPARGAPFLWKLLAELPQGPRYAVELRDAGWYEGEVRERLVQELRDRRMVLAWASLNYLEIPPEVTSDELYLRFIGDHSSIPAETHGEVRADRTEETRRWADRVRRLSSDLRRVLVFFNNHYAGFAPESVNLFRELMGLPSIPYGRWISEGPASNRSTGSGSDSRRGRSHRLDEFS